MYATGMTNPVYAMQRKTTMEPGAIVCSMVLDIAPSVRNHIDMVSTMKNWKSQNVKNAAALRRRFVMKYNVMLNMIDVASLVGRSHRREDNPSAKGW
jgi:hypothetical protein